MKTETKRYAFIALLIILSMLGIIISVVAYRYYAYVARGILGFVVLYLLYYFGRYINMDISTETLLSDPKKGKYLISAFIVPIISSWAAIQIYAMILFFWEK